MINRINFSKNNYKIIKILNPYKEKVSTQFVGGYVRKLIEGISSNDVDLASNLKIDLLKKILIKNNIKIFNINMKYQTIKFFYKNNLYEVTSLRKDLYSYHGRHAIIEETNNWMSDAFRRDFTINAIYCDINKNLFDPFNGKHDLLNKRLVFIGNPEIRIKEDYRDTAGKSRPRTLLTSGATNSRGSRRAKDRPRAEASRGGMDVQERGRGTQVYP